MAQYIDLSKYPLAVRLAAHTIGLNHKKPYYRHGKLWYRPYRNYFGAHQNSDRDVWDTMIQSGYVCDYKHGTGLVRYSLTRKGLDWLGGVLHVTIHDEED